MTKHRAGFSVLGTALVVTIIHILVGLSHGGPVAVPDIPAYLAVSQWIHGGFLPESLPYHPGYGLLLSPFGGLSPNGLHNAALILNSVAAGLIVVVVFRLARAMGASNRWIIVLVLLTVIHPVVSSSSRIAAPETLLTLVVLVLVRLLTNSTTFSFQLAGLVAGLSVSLHPRAIIFPIALFFVSISYKRARLAIVGLLPGLGITFLALIATGTIPTMRVAAASSIGSSPNVIQVAAGQILLIAVATAGLGFHALYQGACGLYRSKLPAPKSPVLSFLFLCSIGMTILGSWVLADSEQSDVLLYGRYLDPVLVSLVAVIVASPLLQQIKRKAVLVSALLTFVSFLIVFNGAASAPLPGRRIMTLSVSIFWWLGNGSLFPAALFALFFVITSLTVVSYSKRGPALAVGLLFLLSATSTIINQEHLRNVGKVAEGQVTVARLLPENVGCLSHDSESTKSYAIWLYRMELPEIRHERVSLSSTPTLCSDYLVAGSSALSDCRSARLLGIEPRASWGLWKHTENCRIKRF
jgi:hypothetical protein